ncbi:MAG: M15 family metallopeptidase [Candidatus Babeliaceae bacterium]|nr:M15 family metallopeptidase [Candidatus Babeliaceae bacterium]
MKKITNIIFIFFSSYCRDFESSLSLITSDIFKEMIYSWKDNNPIQPKDLRLVTVSYHGFDGKTYQGHLIVHALVAQEVIEIFKEIFDAGYPIEKLKLVDEYFGNDELSAQDNNSYAFCSRSITGTSNKFSKHSYGLAIDINPLYNPYHKDALIIPSNGKKYLDRTIKTPATLYKEHPCCQAFIKRGWTWGGNWGKTKGYYDYHHFEKDPGLVDKS